MRARIPALFTTALIVLTAPAVAHADPRDDDFVNNLADQGITGDPGKLISTAHMVCTAGSQAGSTVPAGLGRMMPMGYVITTLHLNMAQVGQFVDAAQGAYCPAPASPAPTAPLLAGMPGVPGIPGLDRVSSAIAGG
ncbi:MAG: DUF732 domain-containing protein [Mycobacterium sp.]|nr:DUF732 domain-containing protein [Mycobacterium sp.]